MGLWVGECVSAVECQLVWVWMCDWVSMLRCTASGNKNPIQMGSKVVALRNLLVVLQLSLDYTSMCTYAYAKVFSSSWVPEQQLLTTCLCVCVRNSVNIFALPVCGSTSLTAVIQAHLAHTHTHNHTHMDYAMAHPHWPISQACANLFYVCSTRSPSNKLFDIGLPRFNKRYFWIAAPVGNGNRRRWRRLRAAGCGLQMSLVLQFYLTFWLPAALDDTLCRVY